MTKREFHGPEFWSWLQATYDAARAAIKARRGPLDPIERELARLDREWAATLHALMQ